MEIRLYQINMDRDTENLCYMGQDFLAKRSDTPTVIDASIYDLVFQGDLDVESPEDVFSVFNFKAPEGHIGRSMSVSDVVIMEGADGKEQAYFCDSVGFATVEFDEYDAENPDRNITVVMLEPGKLAKVTEINSSLASMQAAVGGGLIEAVYPFEEEVCVVCNEEGKINGMPLNRALYAEPEQTDMSYAQLTDLFRTAERKGKHMIGYVVFTEDSFDQPYPERSRTYELSSNNKAFQDGMGGYSIFASCLDGTDPCLRLDGYMAAEKGGKDGWKIERCYTQSANREMIDILAGPCFLCSCKGSNFGSLTAEQQERYSDMFKYPEHFFRVGADIKAAPYVPEKNQER